MPGKASGCSCVTGGGGRGGGVVGCEWGRGRGVVGAWWGVGVVGTYLKCDMGTRGA